jgi:hypothetical protein
VSRLGAGEQLRAFGSVLTHGLEMIAETPRGDREGMRTGAAMVSSAIAHSVAHEPQIDAGEVVDALASTLGVTLLGNDASMWTDADERSLRLALAVARRYGVQPVALGGNGELDEFFEDAQDRMTMAMAVCRDDWSYSLAYWFTADARAVGSTSSGAAAGALADIRPAVSEGRWRSGRFVCSRFERCACACEARVSGRQSGCDGPLCPPALSFECRTVRIGQGHSSDGDE